MAYIMNEDSLMTMGMHKGKPMKDVPADYLLWIYENRKWGRHRDLLIYLMEHLEDIKHRAQFAKYDNRYSNRYNNSST
jgi:uncharacterized protein (DUF3820 family)